MTIIPRSLAFKQKSKERCPCPLTDNTKLSHGEHVWVEVPGESGRCYALYHKEKDVILAPAEFRRLRDDIVAENVAKNPWDEVRKRKFPRGMFRPSYGGWGTDPWPA